MVANLHFHSMAAPLGPSSFLQGHSLRAAPAGFSCHRTVQPRGARAGLGDVGNYLADAARQIFTPAKGNQVPWSGTGIGFSGSITHHDQARLREYYSKLRQARMSITGCLDPNASNYNPEAREEDGSCVYIGPSGEQYGKGPDMKKYVNTMLERIVGGDSTAGLDRKLIEEGEIISQDDLDNLRKYEAAIKEILEKSEKQGAAK